MTERNRILILNADTDQSEYGYLNLANQIHGTIFDHPLASERLSVITYNVHQGRFPDANERIDAAILTGSSANILNPDLKSSGWIDRLIGFTRTLIQRNTPILGVCMGAQALAVATEGELGQVGSHADGSPMYELGYPEISLNEAGRIHPLFKNIPPNFRANQAHRNRIVRLSSQATVLAHNEVGIQAFEINETAFGIQFHPEVFLGPAIISLHRQIRSAPDSISRHVMETTLQMIEEQYVLSQGNVAIQIYANFLNQYVFARCPQ